VTKTIRPRLVAVIASAADLDKALHVPEPPDLFELRLDALAPMIDAAEDVIADLPARIIITARHPAEGGIGSLSAAGRRALLHRFLPHADYVDVELRSARWSADVLGSAQKEKVRTILSFHDLQGMPSTAVLRRKLDAAKRLRADVFKVAIRVDRRAELLRLLDFFDSATASLPIAAMGIGKLGRESRLHLARRGSTLNYVYLAQRQTPGQLSLSEARRLLVRHG
jgi:3-dehydroquinate dehydratase-1